MNGSITSTHEPPTQHRENYLLAALVRYFLRLGSTGFGAPIALVGYMQHDR
jgi:chromate transporter